ncbi:MAG: PQQ-binding-like beta-propeller repeat protein [Oscillospiraceae bacterium]|nr:PQQ-binding-like beta-propeller repeat protein [Oscillospiraceae bacterium]
MGPPGPAGGGGDNTGAGYVFVLGGTGAISVLDPVTHEVVRTINIGGSLSGIALNPNTRMAYVSNAANNSVYALDTQTGEIAAQIPVGASPGKPAVNPSTNLVYVPNTADGTVSVIDGRTNTLLTTIPGVGDGPSEIVINPMTNRVYVLNSGSGDIAVISGNTNTVIDRITSTAISGAIVAAAAGTISDIALNICTNQIYTVENGVLHAYDGATNAEVARIPLPTNVSFIAVNQRTNRIYAVSATAQELYIVDGCSYSLLDTVPMDYMGGRVTADSQRNLVYVNNQGESSVSIFDGVTGFPLGATQTTGIPLDTEVMPEVNVPACGCCGCAGGQCGCSKKCCCCGNNGGCSYAYVANAGSNTVSVLDLRSNQAAESISVGDTPAAVASNPNTLRLYVANRGNGTVSIVDAVTSQVIDTVPSGLEPSAIAVNSNTNRVYVANRGSGTVAALDGLSGALIADIPVGGHPDGISVDPLQNRIFVTDAQGGAVTVIDGADNSVVNTVTGMQQPVAPVTNPYAGMTYIPSGSAASLTVVNSQGQSAGTISLNAPSNGAALDAATGLLYVINNSLPGIDAINVNTGETQEEFPLGFVPTGIHIEAARGLLYLLNGAAGNVTAMETATGAVYSPVAVGANPVGITTLDDVNGRCCRPSAPQETSSPPAGQLILAGRSEAPAAVDVASQAAVPLLQSGGAVACCVNQEKQQIYLLSSSTGGSSVNVVSPEGTELGSVSLPPNQGDMAYDPVRELLYVLCVPSSTVTVIRPGARKVQGTFAVNAGTNSIAADPGSGRVYTSGAAVSVYAPEGRMRLNTTARVGGGLLRMTPDSKNGLVYVFDSAGGAVQLYSGDLSMRYGEIPLGGTPGQGALHASASRLYIPNQSANLVHVIDTATNTLHKNIPLEHSASSAVVDPYRSLVYAAGGGYVSMIDGAAGMVSRVFPASAGPVAPQSMALLTQPCGVVYQPAQSLSLLSALSGGGQRVNNGAPSTPVQFGGVQLGYGEAVTQTDPSRFQVGVEGVYEISYRVPMRVKGDYAVEFCLVKNMTERLSESLCGHHSGGARGGQVQASSATVYELLSAGDTLHVELMQFQSDGSAAELMYPYIAIRKVG